MVSFLHASMAAIAVTSSIVLTGAFSTASGIAHQRQQTTMKSPHISSSTSLSMGIFDAFQKAFSNEEYGSPPDAIKATARHILVPSMDDVNVVMEKLNSGEGSFTALAEQYSTCPSRSRGGSLGSFAPGVMVKEFDEVVFSPETSVGEVVGPVQTQFGYHLIVVDKRTGGSDWY